jgi:N-acetylmuramoyl-L-alanine amidase
MIAFRFFIAAAACLLAACAGGVIDTTRTFNTVVIDAGHGGSDSGATTRHGGREKDHTLDVIRRLKPKLEAAGFSTVMTRGTDRFIPLDTRARISNRQTNAIFVSVHFNYSPNRSIHGAEVYYKSRCSAKLAGHVLTQLTALPGVSSRGVRTANFRVLKKNRYPAILVECGYLTNPAEGQRCASGPFHEAVAAAITRALVVQRYGGEQLVARATP